MKALSQRAWALFAAGLLMAAAPVYGAPGALGGKQADEPRIDFTVDLQPWDAFAPANKVGAAKEFNRGDVIRLVIDGSPRKGFHTYPLTRQVEGQTSYISRITYAKNSDPLPLWPPTETPLELTRDAVLPDVVMVEHEKPFAWVQEFYIPPDVKPGPAHLAFHLDTQACDANTCQPVEKDFDIPFTILDSPVSPRPADLAQRLQFTPPPPETMRFQGKSYNVASILPAVKPARAAPGPPERGPDNGPPKSVDGGGPKPAEVRPPTPAVVAPKPAPQAPGGPWDLLVFMWQGILWGALSLVTPCVFPMIPITVSYFLKQSEKSAKPALAAPGGTGVAVAPGAAPARRGHSPVLLAAIYSATIALVLTVAGVLLVQFVQQFSQHWATNFVLGGLFVFFALSLFGMYDIVLPAGLGRLTAAGEGRGGLIGVVFMALTFTVISFACVAPFYGGFIALSGSGATAADRLKLVVGALAFSVTFALPFFVLALFPALLKALPKSGSWLNTVKVVMGFLELAAAFKFLRAAELNFFVHSSFLTYDLVLGIYIALSLACGLYLLGVYRLPHDHGERESLTVPRLLFSVAFLGLGLYLLPGLFTTAGGEQQRPQGAVFAWLDAFLLPEDFGPAVGAPQSPGAAPAAGRLAWIGDLQQGLKQGAEEKKLVFLDFTANGCTNCKYNEGSVFTQEQIKSLLGQYVLVHLYTDNVPPEYHSTMTGAQYHDFQQREFQDDTLPLYAIVKPKDGGGFEVIGRPYLGRIFDPGDFAKFLQEPLLAKQAAAQQTANGE
jgi:thiol:disulfide interchange protein DsbD